MEDSNKNRALLYSAIVMIACFILGSAVITQKIAADCGYSDYLKGAHLSVGDIRIYSPFAHSQWKQDPFLQEKIPQTLKSHGLWLWGFIGAGLLISFAIHKKMETMTSHGTAEFAKSKHIEKMGLTDNLNGVVIGRNPFTDKYLLDNGPSHVFLAAPTRTGKGVGIVIPTGILWKHSIFFFDPKKELWTATAGYRQKIFHQKVMKFEPLCKDGSSASWNPYAEVNFQSFEEMSDVTTINKTMVSTGEGTNKDPFWDNSAITLLNGVVLHLLYKNYQENREIPCPTDAMSFISSPTMDTDHLYSSMKIYPHISPQEYMELEKESEEEGGEKTAQKQKERYRNPLKEIYGPYVPNLAPFVNALKNIAENPLTEEEENNILHLPEGDPARNARMAFENLRKAIVLRKDWIDWRPPNLAEATDKEEIDGMIVLSMGESPFFQLLVHPKVAECAANIVNNAKETRESIIGTAKTALNLYQDPLIKRNTAASDFCFKDLLDPRQAVSLYMVLEPNDVPKLAPLTRLFINTLIAKTVRDMKFDVPKEKKQRLLLMLDEFPQLKKMESIENTLAICAGYGVKICTVVQSVTQIHQIYTKDNSILDNSQVQIYMTPSNIQQAKELSEVMGDKTIKEHNLSGKGIMDKSTNESKIARKLMTPDEVLRLEKDKEIVIVQGARPIKAKKIAWYEDAYFEKRVYDPEHHPERDTFINPDFSDKGTEVRTYAQLFAVHAPEIEDIRQRQSALAERRNKEIQQTEEEKRHERTRNVIARAEKWARRWADEARRSNRERTEYRIPSRELLGASVERERQAGGANQEAELEAVGRAARKCLAQARGKSAPRESRCAEEADREYEEILRLNGESGGGIADGNTQETHKQSSRIGWAEAQEMQAVQGTHGDHHHAEQRQADQETQPITNQALNPAFVEKQRKQGVQDVHDEHPAQSQESIITNNAEDDETDASGASDEQASPGFREWKAKKKEDDYAG